MRELPSTLFFFVSLLMMALGQLPSVFPSLQDQEWTKPLNLFETSGRASEPEVVVDSAGTVHIIWAYSAPGEDTGDSNSLYYARNVDGAWSSPIDFMVSPGGRVARFPSIVVDDDNMLHVVWAGGDTIYYSRAYAADAGSARAWLAPLALSTSKVSVGDPSLSIDGKNLYIVWSKANEGLVLAKSTDGGQTWGLPEMVYSSKTDTDVVRWGRIAIDDAGRMHLVFTYVDTEDESEERDDPFSLFYMRSDGDGQTWTAPFLMADEPNFGQIVVETYEQNDVHVVWNGRAGRHGRYHRFSRDGGDTWSPINEVLSPNHPAGVGGMTGVPEMVIDSTGAVHLISASGGVHYFRWADGQWSDAKLISTGIDGHGTTGSTPSIEYPAVALGSGNQLHVVVQGGFERIWYINGKLPLTETSAEQYTSMDPVTENELQPFDNSPDKIESPTRETTPLKFDHNEQIQSISPLQRMLLFGVPSSLLIALVLLFRSTRRH